MKKFIFTLVLFFSLMSQSVMAADPETGWWWNSVESGRGFSIEQQGNSIFYAAYLYDDSGNNAWYTALMIKNTAGDFTGTMNQFSDGQTLLGSFQAPNVANSNVGDITLAFDTPTTGTMTWPGGVVPIERFPFGNTVPPPKLNIATNSSGLNYSFGTQLLDLEDAPDDTDYNRWGMLHDGTFLRLYFFKQSSDTELYQFALDQTVTPPTTSLVQGFFANPKITDAPVDADTGNVAFVNDFGDPANISPTPVTSTMYIRKNNSRTVYPFKLNPSTNNFEYDTNSNTAHNIVGSPADADFDRWAMDALTFPDAMNGNAPTLGVSFYTFKSGSNTEFYVHTLDPFSIGTNGFPQFVYTGSTLTISNLPANRDTTSFSTVYDKQTSLPVLYQLTQ
jgi:hypothetical protein